jgi:hypothetical protein
MSKLKDCFEPPHNWVRRFESELGVLGRSALQRLVRGGIERHSLYWDLWSWTQPRVWDVLQPQFARGVKQFRREIVRFKQLSRDLKSVEARLAQAVTFFKLPSDSLLSALAIQLQNGMAELDRTCALYTDRRKLAPRPRKTQYDFVDPIIQSVRIRFDHKKREKKPWTGDLAMVLNAAVNAHDWTTRQKPFKFRGDSIRRYLERRRMAIKPNFIEC